MEKGGTVIALGMFDGVHLGHRSLFKKTLEVADRHDLVPMAYTFSNHPISTISSMSPRYILDREESLRRIFNTGMENIVADEFNTAMRDMEPKCFLEMLLSRFSMKAAVVGFNYPFVKGAEAKANTLAQYGREMGFMVDILPGVLYDGRLVSSTYIRSLIE